jgi:hypothetical protein
MKIWKCVSQSKLISYAKLKWQLIAPPYRIFLVFVATFSWLFITPLFSEPETQDLSSQPSDLSRVVLFAKTGLPERSQADLLLFGIRESGSGPLAPPCPDPVSLVDASQLVKHKLKKPVAQNEVLCWSHLEFDPPSDRLSKIRRGHRVLGFEMLNPEISKLIEGGQSVDVVLNSDSHRSEVLSNLKVFDFLHLPASSFILLEVPNKLISKELTHFATHSKVQVLLRNPEETVPAHQRSKSTRKRVKISKG